MESKHARTRKRILRAFYYLLISLLGVVMLFPLVWMASASLKPSNEVFNSLSLIPSQVMWENYVKGWQSVKPNTYTLFYKNTFLLIVPVIIGTVISSCLTAYGFARGRFRLKNLLFILMLSTMMLPDTTTLIPKYMIFVKLGWINTYLPFIVPAFLATSSFFIFMMVQFMRGIPRELDESAKIDGCGPFRILWQIIMPMCIPSVVTMVVFCFIWTWDDFMNQLIYISEVSKFTVTLALRLVLDAHATIDWGSLLAMSLVSILPSILLYFVSQRYFDDGIATTGIKG